MTSKKCKTFKCGKKKKFALFNNLVLEPVEITLSRSIKVMLKHKHSPEDILNQHPQRQIANM